MNTIIESDLYRYGGLQGRMGLVKGIISIPGFRLLFFKRKCELSTNYILKLMYRLIYRRYFIKYGIQIPHNTKIGKGFYIGHFGGIVINTNAIIGCYCNIAHNVTIGQTNRGERKGVPVIGDKVWIGTGSVIVGKISIGDNVLIAPNSYVNFDVPSNSMVIGRQIINKINPTEDYINWCDSQNLT